MENNSKAMMEAKKRIEKLNRRSTLDLSNLGLNTLPQLPNNLETLLCNDNNLSELPTLPDNLERLYCQKNILTSLPPIPNSLIILNCENNKLTSLPPLPDTLVVLMFNNGNDITITKDIFNVWNNPRLQYKDKFEDFSPENQKLLKRFERLEKGNVNLETIKTHKNTAINFTPSKEYFIEGHGSEGFNTFVVPKDCVIVVKAHTAQVSLDSTFINQEDALCKVPIEMLKDPIKYSNEIIEAVGSVLLFTEGMTCPNFLYTLLSVYDKKDDDVRTFDIQSGLIDMDDEALCKEHNKQLYLQSDTPLDTSLIIKGYEGSVLPKQADVKDFLDTLGTTTLDELVENSDFTKMCNVFQKDMIDKIGTGVYYNFVCRAIDKSEELYETVFDKNSNLYYNHPILRNNILNEGKLRNLKTSNKNMYNKFKNVRNKNIIESKYRTKYLAKSNPEFGMASKEEASANIETGTRKRNNAQKIKAEKIRRATREHRQWRNEFGAMRMETNFNVDKREKMDKLVEIEREKAKAQGPEAVARLEEYIKTYARLHLPLNFHGGTRKKSKSKKSRKTRP